MALEAASLMAQRPLLDGGEGKLLTNNNTMDIEIHVVHELPPMGAKTLDLPTSSSATEETGFAGLRPPRLDSTDGTVTGADTPQHRIKNKHRQKATLANQAVKSQ